MTAQKSAAPDYTALTEGQLLGALGDDASLWATAFCQHAKKFGFDAHDEGVMLCWFANAIEASWEKRVKRAEPETKIVFPDLCIHKIPMDSDCPSCRDLAVSRPPSNSEAK